MTLTELTQFIKLSLQHNTHDQAKKGVEQHDQANPQTEILERLIKNINLCSDFAENLDELATTDLASLNPEVQVFNETNKPYGLVERRKKLKEQAPQQEKVKPSSAISWAELAQQAEEQNSNYDDNEIESSSSEESSDSEEESIAPLQLMARAGANVAQRMSMRNIPKVIKGKELEAANSQIEYALRISAPQSLFENSQTDTIEVVEETEYMVSAESTLNVSRISETNQIETIATADEIESAVQTESADELMLAESYAKAVAKEPYMNLYYIAAIERIDQHFDRTEKLLKQNRDMLREFFHINRRNSSLPPCDGQFAEYAKRNNKQNNIYQRDYLIEQQQFISSFYDQSANFNNPDAYFTKFDEYARSRDIFINLQKHSSKADSSSPSEKDFFATDVHALSQDIKNQKALGLAQTLLSCDGKYPFIQVQVIRQLMLARALLAEHSGVLAKKIEVVLLQIAEDAEPDVLNAWNIYTSKIAFDDCLNNLEHDIEQYKASSSFWQNPKREVSAQRVLDVVNELREDKVNTVSQKLTKLTKTLLVEKTQIRAEDSWVRKPSQGSILRKKYDQGLNFLKASGSNNSQMQRAVKEAYKSHMYDASLNNLIKELQIYLNPSFGHKCYRLFRKHSEARVQAAESLIEELGNLKSASNVSDLIEHTDKKFRVLLSRLSAETDKLRQEDIDNKNIIKHAQRSELYGILDGYTHLIETYSIKMSMTDAVTYNALKLSLIK